MIRTYIRLLLFWAFVFACHRLLLALLLTPAGFIGETRWPLLLITGLRFDLMVAVYLCIPLLLSLLVPLITGYPKQRAREFWHRLYLVIATVAVGIVTGLDFAGFSLTGDRWNQNAHLSEILHVEFWAWPLAGAEFGLLLFVAYQIQRWIKVKMDLSQVTWGRWLICAALFVLVARSSLGPQHLDLRQAEVLPSVTAQRVVVPSCYALDQALRDRR